MAINKFMRMALKALSYPDITVKKTYPIERTIKKGIKGVPPLASYRLWDRRITVDDRDILVRIYAPESERDTDNNRVCDNTLIFFHGGGWVTESVDTYNSVCKALAEHTGSNVVSVEYRLAPENPFPDGLEDCYAVARELYLHPDTLGIFSDHYTLIGDSAGGNLAAAVSQLARDRGEFCIDRQVLLYPATHWDHGETSPFDSVRENGTDYLLTAKKINDYMELYRRTEEDMRSPYFSPLLGDLHDQPETLIITAEFDPLRDEGEQYGRALYAAGGSVKIVRMKNALHGFLALPATFTHVRKTYELINDFLLYGVSGKTDGSENKDIRSDK